MTWPIYVIPTNYIIIYIVHSREAHMYPNHTIQEHNFRKRLWLWALGSWVTETMVCNIMKLHLCTSLIGYKCQALSLKSKDHHSIDNMCNVCLSIILQIHYEYTRMPHIMIHPIRAGGCNRRGCFLSRTPIS